MASDLNMQVRIRVRWWVPIYINALIVFIKVFRTAPDMDAVDRMLARGIYAEFE